MQNLKPIIPPGSPLQRTMPARTSKVVVTVSVVLAIHVVLLAGLLMQGCKRQASPGSDSPETSLNAPLSQDTTNHTAAAEQGLAPLGSEPAAGPNATGPSAAPSDYTNASNLPLAATPYVNGAPKTAATSPATVTTSTNTVKSAAAHHRSHGARRSGAVAKTAKASNVAGDSSSYVVKSGDTLTKIAHSHGTTVAALRAANGLKTDRLLVGQKLKMPGAKLAAGARSTEQASLGN